MSAGNFTGVDGLSWDRNLIDGVLSPSDAARVYQQPIAQNKVADSLVWHFTADGVYSVKTGNRLAVGSDHGYFSRFVEGHWSRIWKKSAAPEN
ncbi:hypothetical protein GOBAR_AA33127 [Gossypium barbadense]|uniref:Uncharacterized protein n=1 Tax=Gossypium barbadense TaxID=3634 RepID=A0A2P5W919_GOSBA|nr:hypothetical protein GOBAR_AA33127 [Gossypium barbadense]